MEHSGPSSFPWGWFSGRQGCHHRVFLLQERSLHLDQARILGALWAAGSRGPCQMGRSRWEVTGAEGQAELLQPAATGSGAPSPGGT